jgi:hypothetical protein
MGRVTPSDGCAGAFLRAGVYGKLADDPSLRVTLVDCSAQQMHQSAGKYGEMVAQRKRKPPSAGIGRRPGVPNKVTTDVRQILTLFTEHNATKAQALFERVAKNNPAMALSSLAKLADRLHPEPEEPAWQVVDQELLVHDAPPTEPTTEPHAASDDLLSSFDHIGLQPGTASPAVARQPPRPPHES